MLIDEFCKAPHSEGHPGHAAHTRMCVTAGMGAYQNPHFSLQFCNLRHRRAQDTPSHSPTEIPPRSGGVGAPSIARCPQGSRTQHCRIPASIPLAGTPPGFDGTCFHLSSRFFTSARWKHELEGHDGRKEKKQQAVLFPYGFENKKALNENTI